MTQRFRQLVEKLPLTWAVRESQVGQSVMGGALIKLRRAVGSQSKAVHIVAGSIN